ncbi:MAG TPA: glycosyltransferase family 9 protein [Rhodocyclaceae bacterium]
MSDIAAPARGVRSIAVFRALRLGDMLCAVPALRALRAGFPHARITLVGLPWAESFARRFRHYIDHFMAFPGHPELPEQPVRKNEIGRFYRTMRLCRFDLAVQLHGDGRISNSIVESFGARSLAGFRGGPVPTAPAGRFLPYPQHGQESERLMRLAAFLGMPTRDACLEFPLGPADHGELAASGLPAAIGGRPYLCVHPGASSRAKCWPPECFAGVADALAGESGARIVLTGSAEEQDIVAAVAARMAHPAVEAAAPFSIGALAALMSGARLVVCNDTGVSHVAAGLRLPSVVVFSNSDIERWAPLDSRLHASVWQPGRRGAWVVLHHARRLLRSASSWKAS